MSDELVLGVDCSTTACKAIAWDAQGHAVANLGDADLVIVSAAVPAENPELVAARERGIPILTHAQALGALMATKDGVAVAGTHGKSTTTASPLKRACAASAFTIRSAPTESGSSTSRVSGSGERGSTVVGRSPVTLSSPPTTLWVTWGATDAR